MTDPTHRRRARGRARWPSTEHGVGVELISLKGVFAGEDDRSRCSKITTAGDVLAECIRSSGYYRLKAARLKNVVSFLRTSCDFDLNRLVRDFTADDLRENLLAIKGVGPETADTILLYALGLPFFVVDAYTFRIMNRHGLVPEQTSVRNSS